MRKFHVDIAKYAKEIDRLIQKDMPRIMATEMKILIKNNFIKGGFVNGGLKKWDDVKRRDSESKWFGFEYKGEKRTHHAFTRSKKTGKTQRSKEQKRLNFSETATQRGVLTSKRNTLMNSIATKAAIRKVVASSNHPAAEIHNEGGTFKVFGKHSATMPKRQFMGESKEMEEIMEQRLTEQLTNILG